MKKICLLISIVILLVSCRRHVKDALYGQCITEELCINPHEYTSAIDSMYYTIEDIVPLDLPSSCAAFSSDKLIKKGDRYYIMDARYNRTVFVFDRNGRFLHQLGTKGHARDEYIEGPKNFSVDDKLNVYIYERNSARLFHFDANGRCISVKRFSKCLPDNLVVTEKNEYICAFDSEGNGNGERLVVYDENLEYKTSYMPITGHPRLGYDNCFYEYKDYVYYRPLLSDSIVVLKKDKLDKILKVDFNGEFISDEIVNKAITDIDGYSIIHAAKGVQGISRFEMTDSLIHVEYNYNGDLCHFLMDRKTGKTYNSNGFYYDGVGLQSDFTLCEEKLIYVITEEQLEWADEQRKKNNWQACYNHTPLRMRNIIDRRYKAPLLVIIKPK